MRRACFTLNRSFFHPLLMSIALCVPGCLCICTRCTTPIHEDYVLVPKYDTKRFHGAKNRFYQSKKTKSAATWILNEIKLKRWTFSKNQYHELGKSAPLLRIYVAIDIQKFKGVPLLQYLLSCWLCRNYEKITFSQYTTQTLYEQNNNKLLLLVCDCYWRVICIVILVVLYFLTILLTPPTGCRQDSR